MKRRSLIALAVALVGMPATSAVAVDGVKLIGQPRPTAFPFTISVAGSYRLRSNITVPNENTTAILVTVDNVTIDLNGFSILGPTVCTGAPMVTSCTPTGTGIGIDATGRSAITVLNGTIQGMGNAGIVIPDGQVRGVSVVSNGGVGIDDPNSGITTTVTDCRANSNGDLGMDGVGHVIDSQANFNRLGGISACEGAVSNVSAVLNGGVGIGCVFGPSAVTNSVASGNTGKGITAQMVSNSTSNSNGNMGIQASAATGCQAASNGVANISAVGIVGHNLCSGSPCP